LSKETATELIGEVPFEVEVERRENETVDGTEDTMYPPVVQNQEQYPDATTNAPVVPTKPKKSKDQVPLDKQGPEAKNFKSASVLEMAPYSRNADLPPAVRKLPKHAQDIFRKAFNSALSEYGDETKAFQVAWSAVKKAGYRKIGKRWAKGSEED